jgi:CMP/dCMP kinase
MSEEKHTVVAISRQMGSGGSYIGYLLAKELKFKYIDREILRQAAKNLGTDESWLENYDERSSGIISNILRGFSFGTPEAGCVPPLHVPIYDKDLFTLECRIMNKIADKYNAVIVGRGGFYALKERPEVIKVFIHAPLKFRIKRLMKVQNISEREAQSMVDDSDQKRTRFIRNMVGVEWTDARNYHLCIDSSVIDFPLSVELIIRLIKEISAPR